MINKLHFYNYRIVINFLSSNIDNTHLNYEITNIENLRVKPESEKDLFPSLAQRYIFRPIFRKLKFVFKYMDIKYCAVYFMDELKYKSIFDKFYGAHPDTKSDFIIRIDPENRKYELALYRQGLKEPVIIPQSAYQLIVFKNKFEDYRSENYDQPRGAWIW